MEYYLNGSVGWEKVYGENKKNKRKLESPGITTTTAKELFFVFYGKGHNLWMMGKARRRNQIKHKKKKN